MYVWLQKEREEYEVIVENGKLVYRHGGKFVDTDEKSKWIFVLSTTRALYVGRKQKGAFQHSSFLSGAATTAAGRLVAQQGVLEVKSQNSHFIRPKFFVIENLPTIRQRSDNQISILTLHIYYPIFI